MSTLVREAVSVTVTEAEIIIREWGCSADYPIECPFCGAFFASCECSYDEDL